MYTCKHCGKPVERTIEGELICEQCYASLTEDTPSKEDLEAMRYYYTHCSVCDKPGRFHHQICPQCRKDLEKELGARWQK